MTHPRSLRSVVTLASLAAAILVVAACGRQPDSRASENPAEPMAIRAIEVAPAEWTGALVVSATVEPIRRASPGTVLMGRVERILHREGDRVRAGAVLARIESREVDARLKQADAAVVAAQANEENARLMKERMVRLEARQAAPRRALDDASAGYEAARAGRLAAEEGVATAKMYVAYADVTAPFDGIVTARHVETGDLAAPGVPLFTVEDLSQVRVEAQVPESEGAKLAPGAAVELDVPAAGGPRVGTIAQILPSADPATRTFTVRVVVDNAAGALRSGMFARLRLPGVEQPSPAVPRSAVVRTGPLTGVFVVDDGSVARLRWVSLGEERGEEVRVLAGLAAGETIVAEPPPSMADGRRVRVR